MPQTLRADKMAHRIPTADKGTVSPARRALTEAVGRLRDAERAAAAARAPLSRLELEIAGEAAARARLDALDADYAARMAAWANGPELANDAGPAPDPKLEARQAAQLALTAASLKAEAARGALAATRDTIALADARVGDARQDISTAVAAVLREEGGWMAAEYWRRYAELEQVRRELAALDQVLLTDFPITHAPTGRTIIDWISPEKLPAQATLHASDAACADLEGVRDLIGAWRQKAEALGR